MSYLAIDVFVSVKNQREYVTHALETILASSHRMVTCHVIDGGSTDGTLAALEPFAEQCRIHACQDADTALETCNQVMRESRGDLMMWLDAGDRLCPWGLTSAEAVFQHCAQVQWLASSAPVIWTQTQFVTPGALLDGFSRETFLRGRNLKTGPAFRQAIPRAVTLWRRALWEQCGSIVRAPLERAGDFELWARFWEHANLYALAIPLGGREVRAPEPDVAYWRAAAEILARQKGAVRALGWTQQLRAAAVRFAPRLRQRFGSPAQTVRLRARGGECACNTRYIV